MSRIAWLPGAEEQRREILCGMLRQPDRTRFAEELLEVEAKVAKQPELGLVSRRLSQGRAEVRDVEFGGGYRLSYAVYSPDQLVVFSLLPPSKTPLGSAP